MTVSRDKTFDDQNIELHLAPMEGVTDFLMRDIITSIGGVDHCTTEFLRVTDHLYPDHVFYRNCPELKMDCQTKYHVPVGLQILGGDAEPMLWNAMKAAQLGAKRIDLNFGCPAKLVNRHDGGAALLKSPERLFNIVSFLRQNLPHDILLTSKIRLGFDDPRDCFENAAAVWEAGSTHVTVHCRTRNDGYRPPAKWEWIPLIQERVPGIRIIANGDIFSVDDFKQCHSICKAEGYMIGRGILRDPFLLSKIRKFLNGYDCENDSNHELVLNLICQYYESGMTDVNEFYAMAKLKQWVSQLAKQNAIYQNWFDKIKTLKPKQIFKDELKHYLLDGSSLVDRNL